MDRRMVQRRGTSAQWASVNPILAEGEIGFETDTKIFKLGDGVTPWNSLISPYLTPAGGTITGALVVPTPTAADHAARKENVDAVAANLTTLDGEVSLLSDGLGLANGEIDTLQSDVSGLQPGSWTALNYSSGEWYDYNAGWQAPGSRLEAGDTVRLKGLIRRGTPSNPIICTLPVNQRPGAGVGSVILNTRASNGMARLDIKENGTITVNTAGTGGVDPTTWISFGGLVFTRY